MAGLVCLANPALAQPVQNLRIALAEDADLLDPTLSLTYVGRLVMAARRPLYAEAFGIAHLDLPLLYLYAPTVLMGMSARLTEFVPVADGMIRLGGYERSIRKVFFFEKKKQKTLFDWGGGVGVRG